MFDPVAVATALTIEDRTSGAVPWGRATVADRPSAVQVVASTIMSVRCVQSPDVLEAWRRVVAGGNAYSQLEHDLAEAYVAPGLGLPAATRPSADHAQSVVAEHLWFLLEQHRLQGQDLRFISPPKFYPTGPGGDGIVAIGHPPTFRLWEIKKHVGTNVSITVSDAYGQMSRRGRAYLAELTAIGQTFADQDLKDLFSRLPHAWIQGDDVASIGIAIASTSCPNRCFSSMRRWFPRFTGVGAHRGLLAAVTDLPAFSEDVRDLLWTGL